MDTDGDGIGDACDTTTIHTPGNITADATGPAGATVPYTVTVTDANNLVCAPAPGSLFAIGSTTVGCTAEDLGENTARASFAVTVLGAKDQLVNLTREVVESTGLPPAVKARLLALVAGLDPTRPLQRAITCVALRVFAVLAPSAEWTADANRIRAVLAC